jgi:NADH-quinone oxidoreductase subunit A
MDFHLQTYFPVLVFLLVVLGFAVANLIATHLIGPAKKTPVKLMPYESGMDPIGDARQRFDVRFYLVAILFLVFDVELLFLYPWAVATTQSADESLFPAALRDPIFWEMQAFLATLVVAYIYAWRKGVFQWR